ncbi:MAG: phosphoglycerate kinase [Candidatus Woesearchaeota archaeon]
MLRTINQANLKNKKVFVRCDFNVPIENGKVSDDLRIKSSLETINYILKKNPKQIILASHLGRPTGIEEKYSLKPIIKILKKYIKEEIYFHTNFNEEIPKDKQIILIENLRFDDGEQKGSLTFAKKLSKFADIYINDAFGTSHRKDASMYNLAKLLPSYAGFLVMKEVEHVTLKNQKSPIVAIFGAAKISDKLPLLKELLKKVDKLIIAGASEFTFFKSFGLEIGKSLYEEKLVKEANEIYKKYSDKIIFPVDLSGQISDNKIILNMPFDEIPKQMYCYDVGKQSIKLFKAVLKDAKTIIWNGTLGMFEKKPYDKGTNEIAKFISKLNAKTIICGGDTASAVKKYNFTHVSTGGGASLELLSGKKLPGIEVLSN